MAESKLSKTELRKYKDLFLCKTDIYYKQNTKQNIPKKKYTRITNESNSKSFIDRHLKGAITVAAVPKLKSGGAKLACIDHDIDNFTKMSDLDQEQALKDSFEYALKIKKVLADRGLKTYIEFSGHRGHHIWLFLDEIVPADDLHDAVRHILAKEGVYGDEIFPMKGQGKYGSGIKLPYGIHRRTGERTYFLHDDRSKVSLKDFLAFVESNDTGLFEGIYQEAREWKKKKVVKIGFEKKKKGETVQGKKHSGEYSGMIERVKETNPIREIADEFLGEEVDGYYFCIFHQEGSNPNLMIYESENRATCYSTKCDRHQKRIDVIDIVMKVKGIDRGQAIKFLAERKGIEIEMGKTEHDEKSASVQKENNKPMAGNPQEGNYAKLTRNMIFLRKNMPDGLRKKLKTSDMEVLYALHMIEAEHGRIYPKQKYPLFYASSSKIEKISFCKDSTIRSSRLKLINLGLIKFIRIQKVVEIIAPEDIFKIPKNPAKYFHIPDYNQELLNKASKKNIGAVKGIHNRIKKEDRLKVLIRRVVEKDGEASLKTLKNQYNMPADIGAANIKKALKVHGYKMEKTENDVLIRNGKKKGKKK